MVFALSERRCPPCPVLFFCSSWWTPLFIRTVITAWGFSFLKLLLVTDRSRPIDFGTQVEAAQESQGHQRNELAVIVIDSEKWNRRWSIDTGLLNRAPLSCASIYTALFHKHALYHSIWIMHKACATIIVYIYNSSCGVPLRWGNNNNNKHHNNANKRLGNSSRDLYIYIYWMYWKLNRNKRVSRDIFLAALWPCKSVNSIIDTIRFTG